MSGFYFTFLAVLLAGLGARDQVTLAGLTARQGARPSVLIVGVLICIATAAFAAWAASLVLALMPPPGRLFLAALALAFAGAESLLLTPGRRPQEPTNSLGALAVVLLAHQATDAARFLVFAIAVAAAAPFAAGLSGAIAGALVLAAGWFAPTTVLHPRLRRARRIAGGAMLLLALFLGLRAVGWI